MFRFLSDQRIQDLLVAKGVEEHSKGYERGRLDALLYQKPVSINIDEAVQRLFNVNKTSTIHYSTRYSIPCRDCDSRAYLTVIQKSELDGGLVLEEQLVVECRECDWLIRIADTKIGTRFLVNLFNQMETFEE